jgi:hypothetical protein
MLPNAFINKPKKPTDDELTEALGPAKALWDKLITALSRPAAIPKSAVVTKRV